ncbi:MAG: DUF393 domain-containing protein [Planctomycetes bacterium]|nr:DUF393 domain-containing protein [Planctomycetota bacterium]
MSTASIGLTVGTEESLQDDQTVEVARCILFFDGDCGLCNRAVDFVLKRDQKCKVQFAPLQGETARQLLPESDTSDLNSMVVLLNGKRYRKSAAAVRLLWQLGLFWKVMGALLWLIPLPLRDFGYFLVASNRYRFFGKKESCRLPTNSERLRFLP